MEANVSITIIKKGNTYSVMLNVGDDAVLGWDFTPDEDETAQDCERQAIAKAGALEAATDGVIEYLY